MTLAPGTCLGSYEIVALLGAGGMGEVYRARDPKLNRGVAIKVLPDTVATDPDRLARFHREAQVLASLNHPNVAHIHGYEEWNGVHALVMELVEGPTIADRIAEGPIPLEDALPVARQIAEALEAAHEQGIIHRDLKPANIKVRDDGMVKVLDFGLAKLAESGEPGRPGASDGALSISPTISTPAMVTGVGVILGTAAYMAPEQAKGQPADKRSDIWAFGCVLYEILTGKRPFNGEDVSDTLAAVLRADPDWTALPTGLPPTIHTLLQRSLTKDRTRRVDNIAIAKFLLDEPGRADAPHTSEKATGISRRYVALSIAALTLTGAMGAGAALWPLRRATPKMPVARFAVVLPDGQAFTNTTRQVVAISPDGTKIVYVANNRLYVRGLADLEARVIPGTEIGDGIQSPAFSPDGQEIVFRSSADGTLKRLPISGGTAVTIASPSTAPLGVRWAQDGLVFAQNRVPGREPAGILRVSENGGTPERLVTLNDGEVADSPQVLPGGQAVLFTLLGDIDKSPRVDDRWDRAKIVVQSLRTGGRTTVLDGASDARYLPTGYLAYAVGGNVFAARFDVDRLKLAGAPVRVLEGVQRDTTGATGVAQLSVSDTGTLVYVPGAPSSSARNQMLVITDRTGMTTRVPATPGLYTHPRVSRDGTRVAVESDEGQQANVWIYDLSGRNAIRRLTFAGHNRFPIWSGDGQWVAFQSDREGDVAIYAQRADGTGGAERLTKPDAGVTHVPESWSPDGRTLLFSVFKDATYSSWSLSLDDKQVQPFGNVHSAEPIGATFSPDGKWVAYSSNDVAGGTPSPNRGVYLQPFPATGNRYQMPKERSDFHPAWGAAGLELLYAPTGGRLSVVSVQTRPTVTFGPAVGLPPVAMQPRLSTNVRDYDVLPDGRILSTVSASGAHTPQIYVVLNWSEELRQRVAAR